MPFPPTIPTSFVPRPGAANRRSFQSTDFTGAFAFLSYAVLAVVTAAAVGVFLYGQFLAQQKKAKDDQLQAAESAIDSNTADAFVRLSNRLVSGKTLIAGHIALSRFFTDLDSLLPTGVRLDSLSITPTTGASAKLTAAGTALTFNQLAVLSSKFADDGNIKDAIFSNLTVDSKNSSVSFALTASVDPSLIAFSANAVAQAAVSASSTATTTSP